MAVLWFYTTNTTSKMGSRLYAEMESSKRYEAITSVIKKNGFDDVIFRLTHFLKLNKYLMTAIVMYDDLNFVNSLKENKILDEKYSVLEWDRRANIYTCGYHYKKGKNERRSALDKAVKQYGTKLVAYRLKASIERVKRHVIFKIFGEKNSRTYCKVVFNDVVDLLKHFKSGKDRDIKNTFIESLERAIKIVKDAQ